MSEPAASLDPERIPRHVAIIMDGNGRWANARGLHRTAGHARGEPALFDVVHGALDLGIEWLTVYTFSTENWGRDPDEVAFLMEFNVDLLERRRDELDELGVRVIFIGDHQDERIPQAVLDRMRIAEEQTAGNTKLNMVYALRISNYLLWQVAYSELVFTPVLWPDFDRRELANCIAEYQARERRYGGAIDGFFDDPARPLPPPQGEVPPQDAEGVEGLR
jgi:undecaprenyl diphosphate synthase